MHKPMKPATVTLDQVRYPTLATPKIDGIRGRVIDGALRSNTNNAIPNQFVSACFSRPELTGYDGEIVVGSATATDVCHVTSGTCNTITNQPADVTFYVFDNFAAPGGYRARLATLKPHARVVVLEQTLIHNRAELEAYVKQTLAAGYEGVICRSLDGPYKQGRSTVIEGTCLRIKPREDAEAEILEVLEEQHNGNIAMANGVGRMKRSLSKSGMSGTGRAGSVRARDLKSGVEFTMGGFNDKEREEFWACRADIAEAARIGRPIIAKYQRQAYGSKKTAPRSPTYQFLVARPRWDVEELA